MIILVAAVAIQPRGEQIPVNPLCCNCTADFTTSKLRIPDAPLFDRAGLPVESEFLCQWVQILVPSCKDWDLSVPSGVGIE